MINSSSSGVRYSRTFRRVCSRNDARFRVAMM